MREIFFKAKRKDDGKWVEGYYYKMWENHYVLWGMNNDKPDMIEIDPETLCQYTGMTDKDGDKIWENDIAKCDDELVTIEWDDDYKAFVVVSDTVRESLGEFEEYDFEIVGNVFDDSIFWKFKRRITYKEADGCE